jgi:hypothetical protein
MKTIIKKSLTKKQPMPAESEARWDLAMRSCDSGSDGESLVDDRSFLFRFFFLKKENPMLSCDSGSDGESLVDVFFSAFLFFRLFSQHTEYVPSCI